MIWRYGLGFIVCQSFSPSSVFPEKKKRKKKMEEMGEICVQTRENKLTRC